jgi:uncharacterized protein YfaA (DUF2138 family)
MTDTPAPAAPGRTRRSWILVVAVLALLAAGLAAYRHLGWQKSSGGASRLHVNLAAPDALIASARLSQLPRDLLRVPVLRDVLTEDIAFYYEQHEDRLGLKGSLKRIAWEHKLGWSDKLLAMALDEPAELAFWRDGNGALRHYALVMRRGALARVVQEAAAVALKDKQLTRLQDTDGHGLDFPVYALKAGARRTFVIAAKGDRIAVLSDAGMLFGADGRFVPAARETLAGWLAADGVLARHFKLDGRKSTHTVAIGAAALSLGYAAFVPGIEALRFDLVGEEWQTRLLLRHGAMPKQGLGDAQLWRAAPANASACLLLPLDAQMPQKVVQQAKTAPGSVQRSAASAIDGSALACWYPHSTLYAPVFVARIARPIAADDAVFAELAKWALKLPGLNADDETMKRSPLPLPRKGGTSPRTWRAEGATPSPARNNVAALLSAPTLAASEGLGVFSPDAGLVELTLDTIGRKYPGIAEQLPEQGVTLAVIAPRMLAGMVEREANAAVPKAHEEVLSAALQTHLAPRMKALAKYPDYRLVLLESAAKGNGWQPASWEPLK